MKPDPLALVFTNEKGGPLRPHALCNEWAKAKEVIGLAQLHLHDLRHAGNTWAAATGASTKEHHVSEPGSDFLVGVYRRGNRRHRCHPRPKPHLRNLTALVLACSTQLHSDILPACNRS